MTKYEGRSTKVEVRTTNHLPCCIVNENPLRKGRKEGEVTAVAKPSGIVLMTLRKPDGQPPGASRPREVFSRLHLCASPFDKGELPVPALAHFGELLAQRKGGYGVVLTGRSPMRSRFPAIGTQPPGGCAKAVAPRPPSLRRCPLC